MRLKCIISAIIFALAALCCTPAFAATPPEVTIDGITYQLDLKTVKVISSTADITEAKILSEVEFSGVKYPVAVIGDKAFYGCKKLTSVEFPNTLTTIGNEAFMECDGLTSVILPEGLTKILLGAFWYCSNLSEITIPSTLVECGQQTFNTEHPIKVNINNLYSWFNITFIGPGAGGHSNPMCNGGELYLNGELVTEIVIPDNVDNIQQNAFFGCASITKLNTSNVSTIGGWSFETCSKLKTVILGSLTKRIDNGAFSNCSSLEEVFCHASKVPEVADDAFAGSAPVYMTLHVPTGSKGAYEAHNVWGKFGTIIDDLVDYSSANKIQVDDLQSPIEYYDLRGISVGVPQKGNTYIRRQGNTNTKVIF